MQETARRSSNDTIEQHMCMWAITQASIKLRQALELGQMVNLKHHTSAQELRMDAGFAIAGDPDRRWNARLSYVCRDIGHGFAHNKRQGMNAYHLVYLQALEGEVQRNDLGLYWEAATGRLERFTNTDLSKAWLEGCYPGGMTRRYFVQARTAADDGALRTFLRVHAKAPGVGVRMLPPTHLARRAMRYALRRFLAHYWRILFYETHGYDPEPYEAYPPGYAEMGVAEDKRYLRRGHTPGQPLRPDPPQKEERPVSLYRCDICGCIENTALAQYWQRKAQGEPLLCSACDPDMRAWHGTFPQRSALGMLVDRANYLWHPRNITTMPTTYEIVGIVQEQGLHPVLEQ